jgi:hypothetical protein
MTNKLFEPVKEGYDGKGRVVFICQDKNGFYVYKPATCFKTKHWAKKTDKVLLACYNRQVSCTQNNGFFEKGEAPAAGEDYSLEEATAAKADGKQVINKTAAVVTPEGQAATATAEEVAVAAKP